MMWQEDSGEILEHRQVVSPSSLFSQLHSVAGAEELSPSLGIPEGTQIDLSNMRAS